MEGFHPGGKRSCQKNSANEVHALNTVQKMKKSLVENFIFCAVKQIFRDNLHTTISTTISISAEGFASVYVMENFLG